MTIRLESGKIVLTGDCSVQEAEPLLAMLQSNPDFPVEISTATHLNAAVLQILMAFQPELTGEVNNSFLRRWIAPLITSRSKKDVF
jgi:hypothetical protein